MKKNSTSKTTLGEIVDFYNGKSVKASDVGEFPVYGSNGRIGFSDEFKYDNGIIIGRVGAYCGSIEYCSGKFWASDNTIVASSKHGPVFNRYTAYLLIYLDLHRHAGGAAQPLLTQTNLRKAECPNHGKVTQLNIAGVLSAYDDLIENNSRRIAILEEMAQAIYREWFVNFRFPGHEKVKLINSPLGKIPEGWKALPLSDVADVNALSIKKGMEPDKVNYIDIASVSTGAIDEVRLLPFSEAPGRARRIVRNGDLIWSTVRPNRKSYSLILNPLPNMIVSTGFAVISGTTAPFSYLYHTLTTDEFVGYLVNHATGSAYPAVNSGDFEKATILVPSEDVLARFHETTEPMFLDQHCMAEKNRKLRASRDLLLPKLISGQLEVEELDII